jgi:hypothetical protein
MLKTATEPASCARPWQEPSVPVLQKVSVPAATARVVAPLELLPQVAARKLQVWPARSAVSMTAVLPALPVTEMAAYMAANSAEGTVSTRPEEPHASVPPVAVASTRSQQLDWSARVPGWEPGRGRGSQKQDREANRGGA